MLKLDAPHEPVTHVVDGCRTLGDVFMARVAATPDAAASFQKETADGPWRRWSWTEKQTDALRVSRGLIDLGLELGDVVAIMGPTRVEWALFDLGTHLLGGVTVGIYPKQSPDQIRYLLEHSESKVVFVDNARELDNLLAAVDAMAKDGHDRPTIVPWHDSLYEAYRGKVDGDGLLSPQAFRGEPLELELCRQRQDAVDPSDTAMLVYTSGTTGPPKGAMISHENILSVQRATPRFLTVYRDDLMFAFLPMAHVTQRVLGFYLRLNTGVAMAYATDIGAVLAEVGEACPTIFGSVPRLYEKAYAKVFGELENKSPVVRGIFRWALGVGRRRAQCQLQQRPIPFLLGLQDALAHRLVFRKVHAAFGGRVRFCLTGAAPTAKDILEFFWAVGLPLCEAYGMTEATVLTHINQPTSTRLGTVGQTIDVLECCIASDGEILIKGPFVFKGYLKNPEATAETIVDGWLHSGDIGTLDDDGFLRITDRKKHLIITAGGKNVAPANIEGAIKTQSPLISQIHVHGDRRAYLTALIAPSPLETLQWGLDHGHLTQADIDPLVAELMADPTRRSDALAEGMGKVTSQSTFQNLFLDAVRQGNQSLARVERVRRYIVHPRDFSQEGGELTPTMKVKRKAVESKYAELFDRIYEDPEFSVDVGGEG